MQDAELVRRARAGDKSAFGTLIERYQGAVYGYTYHRLGDFDDAQDVAQEAFLAAYHQLAVLREPAKFAGWLRGIATNHCRRHLRARQREPVSLDAEEIILVDGKPTPEDRLEENELQLLAARLLAGLTEENRLTMTLRYLDDLSYEEIGRFLDVPVSTVKGRLYKSRKKLEKEMILMVKRTFDGNKLGGDFAERVMQRVGIAEIGLGDDWGNIWFSTEDRQIFVLRMPAAQVKPISDGPKASLREERGIGLADDLDQLPRAPDPAESDPASGIYNFIREVMDQFGLKAERVILDAAEGDGMVAEVVVQRQEQTRSISLHTGAAIALAGRLKTPVYATSRTLEMVSFAEGAADPVARAEVRKFATTNAGARQFRLEILAQALDERAEQVRISRREEGVEVAFVKAGETREVAILEADALEQLRQDVVFRLTAGEGHLYASRGDGEYVLTSPRAEEGADLVLNIAERKG